MLSESVINIKGVGEKLASDFQSMDIHTIEDLLFYFSYRYDVFEIKPLSEFINENKVTIEVTIINNPKLSYFRANRSRLAIKVEIAQIAVKAVMFNRAFTKKHIRIGEKITLTRKWHAPRRQITLNNYKKGTA